MQKVGDADSYFAFRASPRHRKRLALLHTRTSTQNINFGRDFMVVNAVIVLTSSLVYSNYCTLPPKLPPWSPWPHQLLQVRLHPNQGFRTGLGDALGDSLLDSKLCSRRTSISFFLTLPLHQLDICLLTSLQPSRFLQGLLHPCLQPALQDGLACP